MSCNCCCEQNIRVTTVESTAALVTLVTSTTLSTALSQDARIELILNPKDLPTGAAPVQLSDGTTTVPLEMPYGDVMRENIFLPASLRREEKDCLAHVHCVYGEDGGTVTRPHLTVLLKYM